MPHIRNFYRITLYSPSGAPSPGPIVVPKVLSACQSIAGLCIGPEELPLYLEAASLYSSSNEEYIREGILNLRRVIQDHMENHGWPVTIRATKEPR